MNELTQYREKPLTLEDFSKLENLASRFMAVKEKTISKPVPVADNDGNIYRWEYDLIPVGTDVCFTGNPDERVMDAIMRPATRQAVAIHLARLCQHKPYARGHEGFQVVVEDMLHDLDGCSEWAVIKTCEHFRLSRTTRFFPDTADFVDGIKKLDDSIRVAYANRQPAPKQIPMEKHMAVPKPNEEQKAKIAKMLHDAGIAHDGTFCEGCGEEKHG